MILFVVAIALIIAGGVYFALTGSDTPDNTNAANTAPVNNVLTNTNNANTNTLITPPLEESPQTPQNTNTQSNTNTNTVATTVTPAQIFVDPSTYDNEEMCIIGSYQESFEFSAFGSGFSYDADGNRRLDEPYIWVSTDLEDRGKLSCRTTNVGQEICTGEVTACGTFAYAAPGEEGFGHVNAYRYQLTQEPEPTSNIINSAY